MSTPGNRVATSEASQAMPVPEATSVFMSALWRRKAEAAPAKNSRPHQNSTGALSSIWVQGLVNQSGSQLRCTPPSMWGRLASITSPVSTAATTSLRRSRVSSWASSRSIPIAEAAGSSAGQQDGLVIGEFIRTRSTAMACLFKLWDPVHGRVKPSGPSSSHESESG